MLWICGCAAGAGSIGKHNTMSGVAIFQWLGMMLVVLISRVLPTQCKEPLMPAMFVFGDSLVDVGNNNYLLSLARANYPPNGLDFPEGPTGRFCNNRTASDWLVELLGMPFPPAYLDPKTKGPAILKGINYASGAGGILEDSGNNLLAHLSMNKQLDYLTNTRAEFVEQLGEAKTAEIFSKSLFYITMGSNEYLNNYLVVGSKTKKQYTPEQFVVLIISEFNKQLRRLYSLGARKIFLFGVGPLGCIPSQLFLNKSPDGSCIEFINTYVRGFNEATRVLAKELTASLPGSIFVYGNVYDLVADIIANPANYGFSFVNKGCCGLGPYNGAIPCLPIVKPCPDRSAYFFWDPYHPTDKGNFILASKFFSGGLDAIEPMNVQQLAGM
ncbi:hypothetical protein M758_7G036300 [Ceratodon purpureus]|uniref:Uncharacterized protein n=1 Tax=Ceratodon purpureus TaxID=3225 RepID=A0A8T0H483_CERPU|nr:hypothetical protein KC19_7G037800 [Ceratodon purpureus]KAG0610064.1 hypothetical protein M758_7G036300 [Ceratodon purpureus]